MLSLRETAGATANTPAAHRTDWAVGPGGIQQTWYLTLCRETPARVRHLMMDCAFNCFNQVRHAAETEYSRMHTMTMPVTVALLVLWSVAMVRYGRSILFPPASLGIVWTLT